MAVQPGDRTVPILSPPVPISSLTIPRSSFINTSILSTSHSVCGPEESEVFICLTGEYLEVKNTGVFLPEEEIDELFTPFYRVEKSRNACQMGLVSPPDTIDRLKQDFITRHCPVICYFK